jgi:hypothetical protein
VEEVNHSAPEGDASRSDRAPTVFLSYASADREAARVLRDGLPALGLEVWYDESELGGGEAWDQKIRKQIRECDFFMPLISAQTEARHEGYFRREWRLAVERTLDIADDHPFLLPVVIDDTTQTGARVPEKFMSIQWVRVPGGQPNAALRALCRRLVTGEPAPAPRAPGAEPRSGRASHRRAATQPALPVKYPEFPAADPKSKVQHGIRVVGWAARSAWIFFNQLPRFVRIVVYVWLCIALMSKGCSSDDHRSSRVSRAEAEKLNAISEKYHGSFDKKDISQLAAQIARLTSDDETPAARSPLLAIPFAAPAGNAEASKIADSTFALVYGKIAIAHRGRVGLSQESARCDDVKSAADLGRSNHSAYVLCGVIGGEAGAQVLSVKFAKSDGTVSWSKSYPVAGADPAKIAEEVNSHVPSLEED